MGVVLDHLLALSRWRGARLASTTGHARAPVGELLGARTCAPAPYAADGFAALRGGAAECRGAHPSLL